jgi:hypothetical protein
VTTTETLAVILPDFHATLAVYHAERQLWGAMVDGILPSVTSQTDPDEEVCHCGLPESDHKYPGAAEHNFVPMSQASEGGYACLDCSDTGHCSACHGTTGYPAASCRECWGSGKCPFCRTEATALPSYTWSPCPQCGTLCTELPAGQLCSGCRRLNAASWQVELPDERDALLARADEMKKRMRGE